MLHELPDRYPVGLLEAITYVTPLCFGRIIAEHQLAPQVLPWTTVDLLHQDLTPWLPHFFQEEVGVELKGLIVNVHYCTHHFGLGLSGLVDSIGVD
jgi:hypothetical protein